MSLSLKLKCIVLYIDFKGGAKLEEIKEDLGVSFLDLYSYLEILEQKDWIEYDSRDCTYTLSQNGGEPL